MNRKVRQQNKIRLETHRKFGLIEIFHAHAAGRYDESVGKDFLKSANAFADWAEEKGQTDLSESLSAAAADFQMIFDSPMDLDDNLLSVIWDQLRPALMDLRRDAGSPRDAAGKTDKGKIDKNAKPDAPSAATHKNSGTAAEKEKTAEKPARNDNRLAKARFVRAFSV